MNNRTHMCGEVTAEVAGQSVILKGWVQRARNLGGIVFVWLRDRTGIVQVVFDGNDISKELLELAESLRSEYVIEVHGQARMRAPEAVNKKLKTGEVEVVAESAVILNASKTPPIYIEDDTKEQESLRLKYRYLDLRRPSMQNMLLFRHKVIKLLRDYMDEQGFIEVETPILSKSTPEGARDYLVPARVKPGTFYALPQSPQIYKQLLMLAGLDKYYQVARCFRDEDGRADRQPEFTQFDMEMSFIDPEDIQTVVEGAYAHVFKELMGVELSLPLRRITWRDAMARYGSDKPDTRFGMEIQDVSEVVAGCGFRVFEEALAAGNTICAICAGGAGHLSRKELDALGEFVKTYHVKGLAWAVVNEDGTLRSSFAKAMQDDSIQRLLATLAAKPGDAVILSDEAGFDYTVAVASVNPDRVEFALLEKRPTAAEPSVEVTLFAGYPKQDKLEFIVQKAVELGAVRVVPFFSRFCVAAPKKEEQKNARYARIAAEAAKQAGRGLVPAVELPLDVKDLPARFDQFDLVLFFYEGGGESLRTLVKDQKRIALITGAEGGFSPEEAAALTAAGAVPVGLGPRILRCETAPVAGLAAVMTLAGQLE